MNKPLLSLFASLALLGSSYDTQAQTGASLNFDGSNDIVDLGSGLNSALDNLNTITVEAWVYPTTTTGLGVIIGNYNTTANNGEMQFLLRRDNDTYSFWVDDGTGFNVVNSPAATAMLNTWQHVAGTWDGSELKMYINGILQNTTTGVTGANLATTANPIYFGGNFINELFMGNIDEARLWGNSRSQGLIQQYMNCNVTDTAAGLLAMYSFNEGVANGFNLSNTILHNVAGTGNLDGTLTNFGLFGTASNYVADHPTNYLGLQSSVGSLSNVDRLNNGAAADFDNDGDQDMMVTDDNGAPRLYINDGRGNFFNTFVSGIAPTAGWPRYATGDLDGDGVVDFVLTNGTNTVTAYINDGSGGFTPGATNLFNGTGASSVAKVDDVNGDGKMDVIVGNDGTGTTDSTQVWLNTGTGTAAFTYASGLDNSTGGKSSIAVGDVDGDGDVDIVTGSYSNAAELFLNNNNNGTFTQGILPTVYSNHVWLYDWDQDGDLDYATYDYYNNVGLRVFNNNGSGTFATPGTTLLQSAASPMLDFGDLNGDGYPDAVLSHWGGNAYVYLSDGCHYTLQTGCNYTLDYADNFVTVTDFNADGTADIFCGARNHLSTAHMNFLTPVSTPAFSQITSSPDVATCIGNSAVLNAVASNAGTVNWYAAVTGGSSLGTGTSYTTSVLSSTTTVSYYAEATNANGCITSARDTVNVTVNSLPNVAATATSMTLCLTDDDTLNASGAVNYAWSSNANSAATGSVVITPTVTGSDTYTVTGTDGNGCVNTSTVSVTVINCSAGINSANNTTWAVYPNPSSGNFTLQSAGEIGAVEVRNALGELVYKANVKDTQVRIDLSKESAGIYYLNAQGRKAIISKQ